MSEHEGGKGDGGGFLARLGAPQVLTIVIAIIGVAFSYGLREGNTATASPRLDKIEQRMDRQDREISRDMLVLTERLARMEAKLDMMLSQKGIRE